MVIGDVPLKAQRRPKGHTANSPSVSPCAYTEPFWRIYAQADINGPWLGGFGMRSFKGSWWEIVEFPEMPALPAIENDPRNESGYGSLCFSLHSLYTLSLSNLGSLFPPIHWGTMLSASLTTSQSPTRGRNLGGQGPIFYPVWELPPWHPGLEHLQWQATPWAGDKEELFSTFSSGLFFCMSPTDSANSILWKTLQGNNYWHNQKLLIPLDHLFSQQKLLSACNHSS